MNPSPTGHLRPSEPRINPVSVVSDEVAEILSKGLNGPSGVPLNIFSTLAHHPAVLKRFTNYAGYFLNRGLLPAREREIVILRIGWNCQSVYEFGQHTVIGQRVGLTMEVISALTTDPAIGNWSETDLALIDMADDLCRDNCVSQPTRSRLAQRWNEAELIELVMVAGTYRLVSGFLNTVGVELDTGTPGWPTN